MLWELRRDYFYLKNQGQLHRKGGVFVSCYCYFSCVRCCATPETSAHQAPPSLDSPGKNIGVGCHFLLQCMKVKSQSEVAQSCLTLSDPMDCSLPGSSVHGIFQARVLEWSAIAFSVCVFMCKYIERGYHRL